MLRRRPIWSIASPRVFLRLDLRGGGYDGPLNAEVTRPDGTVVSARVVGSLEDGYHALVRTDRAQPGSYALEVQDEVGFEIGATSIVTR